MSQVDAPVLPQDDTAETSSVRREWLAMLAQRPAAFNATSLIQWLTFAREAGVAAVPAEVVAELPMNVLALFDGDQAHLVSEPLKALQKAIESAPEGYMLRWDCCSGISLKSAMHRNKKSHQALTNIEIDDPRFFDIAFEYLDTAIPVLRRPWQDARYDGTHPVEYRVFVIDNQLAGISNYYMQRPLALNLQIESELRATLEASQAIVSRINARGAYPWSQFFGNGFEEGKVSCTLDFIVAPGGQPMFLEGGPPFGAKAHPCCFMKHVEYTQDHRAGVSGVALADGGEILSIEPYLPSGSTAKPGFPGMARP